MTEPLPASMSPENLTSSLRSAGALGGGRVSSVIAESTQATFVARITRLRLAYGGDAGSAPAALILKTGLPERITEDWNGGRREVEFYVTAGAATPTGALPRCFLAEWNPETNESRLLLEDLSESHTIVTTWPLPPTRPDCERIVGAWARFHAYWWDDPRLGQSIGLWPDAEAIDAYLKRLAAKVAEFDDRMGDRMPPERRDLYLRLLDRAPRLIKRTESRRGVTITHGDAHVWNCLLPREGGDDVRLFDWSEWNLDVAANDLAYMMAVHWYPDRRHRLERALLDAYHAALLMHGVKNYDRQALDDDYRLSALWHIMTPVWQAELGLNIPAVIWWNNFERIHMAVEDLGCRELLK
jgi:hypothetical protein